MWLRVSPEQCVAVVNEYSLLYLRCMCCGQSPDNDSWMWRAGAAKLQNQIELRFACRSHGTRLLVVPLKWLMLDWMPLVLQALRKIGFYSGSPQDAWRGFEESVCL